MNIENTQCGCYNKAIKRQGVRPNKYEFGGEKMAEKRFDFKAAVCGDATGVIKEDSTLEALAGGSVTSEEVVTPEGNKYLKTTVANGVVKSETGNFNGVILRGGEWLIKDTQIDVKGAIGNDFMGLGAGIFIEGDADVVVDNVKVHCGDPARTAVLAKQNSKLLVKNSSLSAMDGVLDPDYVGTVFPDKMKSTPWMLGINGNARGTNLMDKGVATYFNSDIKAEKWGVLSTDDNQGVNLYAINCNVALSGGMKPLETIFANAAAGKFDFYEDEIDHDFAKGEWQSTKKPSGYGTYSIGPTTVTLAGTTMVVPDFLAICANDESNLRITSSVAPSISKAHRYLEIANEVKEKRSAMFSGRFGVMYHSGSGTGVTAIEKGTVLYTAMAAFLVKGCGAIINVDESSIYTGNGIILQVMDNDDAGINTENLETTTDYVEAHVVGKAAETSTDAASVVKAGGVFATFSNTTLNGDIYNASGWEKAKEADALGGMGDYENEVGGGSSKATDLNLILDNVAYTGIVSTTEAYHQKQVITHVDYDLLGVVANTVCVPENAGIVVNLRNNTTWNVTGTGYVTSLTVDETSSVGEAKVYVDGALTEVKANETYIGVVKIVGSATKKQEVYVNPAKIATGLN